MKAARLYAPGDLRVERVPIPTPAEGEALVKVKAVGVCGSDMPRVMQIGTYKFPTIPGHEFSGEIADLGSDSAAFSPGDRVTVIPMIPCKRCDYCRIGEYQLCDDYSYLGSRTDGAYAQYVVVPAENLLRLPDQVSLESGAMTDPVSVALHAVKKARVQPEDRVAVFGVGPIGLFAVQWARIMGAGQMFAVDVFAEKLEAAKGLGADICINNRQDDAIAVICEHTGGKGVQRAIEFAGHPTTQGQCILAASKRGVCVWGGISHRGLELSEAAVDAVLRKELAIVGSWNASFAPLKNDWKQSIEFMRRGEIETTQIISHRLPLDDVGEVFQMMLARREHFNKVMFFPEM
jgi:L-iditol 2-dehydrogenase